MSIVHTIMLALGSSCFLSFIWAVRWHFRQEGRMPLGMRGLSLLTLLGFGWFLYENVNSVPSSDHVALTESLSANMLAAYLLFGTALILFWRTISATKRSQLTLAFTSDVPVFLQTSGPYAYVRHPFYLSYLLFWTGTAVISTQPLHWAAPAIMTALYATAARAEEQKFAVSPFAAAYDAYRQRTGMLVPRLRLRSG